MTETTEIWKEVKGFEGLYEVSNLGNVRSMPRTGLTKSGKKSAFKGRLLKTGGNIGYKGYILTKNGIQKMFNAHRLVAIAFLDNPENKRTVNHKDGNKSNNNVENLEWATYKENIAHAIDNKLFNKKGKRDNKARLTANDVISIKRKLARKVPHKVIAEKYNVGVGAISFISMGKTWKKVKIYHKKTKPAPQIPV